MGTRRQFDTEAAGVLHISLGTDETRTHTNTHRGNLVMCLAFRPKTKKSLLLL